MTETKQKVLIATYNAPQFYFKIPKDIDIEDKNVVENVFVKHGTMIIVFKDETRPEMRIEYCWEDEVDYKWSSELKVELIENTGLVEDNDENDCCECGKKNIIDDDERHACNKDCCPNLTCRECYLKWNTDDYDCPCRSCRRKEDDDDESDDGFENCDCGYIHHYEDKCPVGEQCVKYEKWKEE